MRSCFGWSMLVLALFSGAGCVSQVQYDELMNQYRQARERNTDLEGLLNQANADNKAMRESMGTAGDELRAQLAKALQDKDAVVNRFGAWSQEREKLLQTIREKDEMISMLSSTFQGMLKKE